MRLIQSWRDDLAALANDSEAAGLVMLSSFALQWWVSYGTPLGYLEPVVVFATRQTEHVTVALVVLRLLARAVGGQFPRRLRVVHRLGALSNRALMFGMLPLMSAGVALLRIVPLYAPAPAVIQFSIVLLVAGLEALRKAPFLPEPVVWRPSTGDAHRQDKPGSLVALAGYLVLALGVIIAGEAVVTQFIPWRAYPLTTAAGDPIWHRLPDNNTLTPLPHSVVRMRYTLTRRELEIERGSVLIKTCPCTELQKAERLPPLTVRTREMNVRLPVPRRGQADANAVLLVRRQDDQTDVFVRRGTAVVLETAMAGDSTSPASWWNSTRPLKVGQWATVTPDHADVWSISDNDANQRLAWTDGMLSFEGKPLSAAVAQINRFSERLLQIEDATIGSVPVEGDFSLEWPNLAERFVVMLERHGIARQIPQSIDGTIGLVAFDADPARFGPAQPQVTQDLCASHRGMHEYLGYVYSAEQADPDMAFDIPGCDLATSLDAFSEQTGLGHQFALAPTRPVFTQPLKGRYRVQQALGLMLAGTGCKATGEIFHGVEISCTSS